jgi:beta-galactosidase GanA
LPVPTLWLDIFQKLKAAGFNCVSFYRDWALLEAKRGHYIADGLFDLNPFFDAAKQTGIYLIARPGPYINTEVSGGGFPGWMQRVKSPFRTNNPKYLEATDKYKLLSFLVTFIPFASAPLLK